jgi:hypothetical protein
MQPSLSLLYFSVKGYQAQLQAFIFSIRAHQAQLLCQPLFVQPNSSPLGLTGMALVEKCAESKIYVARYNKAKYM